MKEINENRRDFIRKAGTAIGFGMFAASFSSIIVGCEQDAINPAPPIQTIPVDISKYPKLAEIGGMEKVVLTYSTGDQITVIIKRTAQTVFMVFTSVCTHNTAVVDLPSNSSGDFVCPLHGATFSSTDGKVKNKPFSSVTDLKLKTVVGYDDTTKILQIKA